MTDATKSVRVVAFQEDGAWVAQCVEYDICTQGRDLMQAQRRMRVALRHEAKFTKDKCGEEFAGLDAAPDYFAAMFESAEATLQGDVNMRIAA